MINFGEYNHNDIEYTLESLARKIFKYRNPGCYDVSEEEIVNILNENGMYTKIEE